MKSFKEILRINIIPKEEFLKRMPENFRERVIESFDSSYDIIKSEYGEIDYHYFDVNTKKYRIFIEKSSDYSRFNKEVQIGFEYFNGNWVSSVILNELSTKEVLGIFGTVLKVIKSQKYDVIYISTDNVKKFRLYLSIAKKLSQELNFESVSYSEENPPYIVLERVYSKHEKLIRNFKQKFKK